LLGLAEPILIAGGRAMADYSEVFVGIGVAKASCYAAGELTAVWVPDEGHEAMRDLVRTRPAAVETLRVHRQQVSAFILKHGRIFPRKKGWTMRYLRWLQEQTFDHPAHRKRSPDPIGFLVDVAEQSGSSARSFATKTATFVAKLWKGLAASAVGWTAVRPRSRSAAR
jgi:transposase